MRTWYAQRYVCALFLTTVECRILQVGDDACLSLWIEPNVSSFEFTVMGQRKGRQYPLATRDTLRLNRVRCAWCPLRMVWTVL